jgi:ferredoxin-NADP reductase
LVHGVTSEDFIFTPERKFNYTPGQYIELTMPHSHTDQRGSRRTFTIASSPTEPDIRIGVRFYDKGSSFKKTLQSAGSDVFLSAGQLGGDFVLPKDSTQKLAFIAGGIGVTPFRSMVKYLIDTNDTRDVALLYGEGSMEKLSYTDIFEEARSKIGAKILYVISGLVPQSDSRVTSGQITPELLQSQLPDYHERLFYISGPQIMVRSVRHMLLGIGVERKNIKVDYFSGYA